MTARYNLQTALLLGPALLVLAAVFMIPLGRLFTLAFTEQTVVNEEAGELVTHGLVHQRGGHGRIDTTGERTNHLRVAHLGADLRYFVVNDGTGRPRGFQPGALVEA